LVFPGKSEDFFDLSPKLAQNRTQKIGFWEPQYLDQRLSHHRLSVRICFQEKIEAMTLRKVAYFIVGWIALSSVLCQASVANAQDKKVKHTIHAGHFERNDSGLKGNKSFLACSQLEDFEAVFGVAALGVGPTKKQNFVTQETFDEKLVIAAIYRGTSEPTISNVQIVQKGDTLTVGYKLKPGRDAGFAMNVPFIFSIPKVEYQQIEFYENDKLVATIKNKTETDKRP
jgi:hypothetical protein